jgi:O-antigen ligase
MTAQPGAGWRAQTADASNLGYLGWLVGAATVLTALHRPPFELPAGLLVADVALFGVLVAGLPLAARQPVARSLLRGLLPWCWCIAMGQGFAAAVAGANPLNPVALSAILRNVLPVLTMVAALGLLLNRPVRITFVRNAYVLTAVVVAGIALIETGPTRTEATFRNPNYTAHFLVLAVLLASTLRSPALRLVSTVLFTAAIARTGSFSAIAMLAAAAGYGVWRLSVRQDPRVRLVIRMFLMVLAGAVLLVAARSVGDSSSDLGSGYSSARFERSSTGRYHLWSEAISLASERPIGYGPPEIRSLEIFRRLGAGEIHNDLFDALVSGGVLGLVGVIGVAVVVWRRTKPNTIARHGLIVLLASTPFRNTWNFRHAWVFIAVSLALSLVPEVWTRKGEA